jgi:hypothetical protein
MEPSDYGSPGQRWQAYMEAAAGRMELLAREGQGESADCARQILHSAVAWSRWEQDLGNALRPVANFRSRMLQIRTLRQASFGWVHRAAPFRYLRAQKVRGLRRRRLLATLYGQFAGYEHSMVVEHETYLRSVCNASCATYLGESVLEDPLYRESMHRYQLLYMEYFRAFGLFTCGKEGRGRALAQKMLPMMKSQLAEMRKALLLHPLRADWLERESLIRRPTGDTQRLPRLDFNLD